MVEMAKWEEKEHMWLDQTSRTYADVTFYFSAKPKSRTPSLAALADVARLSVFRFWHQCFLHPNLQKKQ